MNFHSSIQCTGKEDRMSARSKIDQAIIRARATTIVRDIIGLTGHQVESFAPFKPYTLQRVTITDQHKGQKMTKPLPPLPKKYDAPSDRFEYENWIQEKMMQKWEDLAEREKEQQDLKKKNREEVMRVTEEKWQAPPLVSLRTIHLAEEALRHQDKKDDTEPTTQDIDEDVTIVTPLE